jgi:hypothetical protein
LSQEDIRAALAFAEAVKTERQPWDPVYQEIADYMLPVRAAFTSEGVISGENRHDFLHDDTGPWALDQFANGVHSDCPSFIQYPEEPTELYAAPYADEVHEALSDVVEGHAG